LASSALARILRVSVLKSLQLIYSYLKTVFIQLLSTKFIYQNYSLVTYAIYTFIINVKNVDFGVLFFVFTFLTQVNEQTRIYKDVTCYVSTKTRHFEL
jgi:hypothetical protein